MTTEQCDNNKLAADDGRLLVLGDLHLSAELPARTEAISCFIKENEDSFDTLLLLGDIFEFWIGEEHFDLPDHTVFLDTLKLMQSRGKKIVLLKGNRDFLVAQSTFGPRTGACCPGEFYKTVSAGVPFYTCHGDLICENNTLYRVFRTLIRSSIVTSVFLLLPVRTRYAIGKWMRRMFAYNKKKLQKKFGISEKKASHLLNGYNGLICGHVHSEEIKKFDNDKYLIVLGELTDECPPRGLFINGTDIQFRN